MYVRTMRFALVLVAGLTLALATSTAKAQWGYSPYSYYGGGAAAASGGHAWASAYAGSGWHGWPGRAPGGYHGSYGYHPRHYQQYYPRYNTYGGAYCYPRHYTYYHRW
jgi:hypothetical protein